MNFHPDVLAAHTEFGGDLQAMQALHDRPNHIARIAALEAQLAEKEAENERLTKDRDGWKLWAEQHHADLLRAEALSPEPEAQQEPVEVWLYDWVDEAGVTHPGISFREVVAVDEKPVMNVRRGYAHIRPSEQAVTEATPAYDAVTELFVSAWSEADKAMRKFPQPNYVISKVAEEAGEVVKAAIHCAEGRETPENVIAEIKQAMAMLIRLYVEGDQVHGLPALKAAMEAGR